MTNRYNIRNGGRDFYLSKIQNYLLFIVTRNIDFISNDSKIIELWGSEGM